MPSIEAVEQFKTIVQGLAREPEIRAEMGLPAEEILPPESQLDDDLADLLGGMPTGNESDEPVEAETEEQPEVEAEASGSDLDDLFAASVPSSEEEVQGPSLDDLLGPPTASEPQTPEADPFADFLDLPSAGGSADDFFTEPATPEPPETQEVEAFPLDEVEPVDDDFSFGEAQPEALDDLSAEPGFDAPEEMDDSFFDSPPADDFEAPAGAEEETDFGEAMGDADFPELAGFADTKAEDVEAFDAMQEADEFQLGDFESQFGITADDHTDAEVLNPAQAVAMDVDVGQSTLSLSDEEFAIIQRSLGYIPLNLRLAVEELIGEKEVAPDDLDKVVRMLINRAPIRALAATVGKILGRKIIVPAGFEKGSGAELEALHSSLWYNFRTIMLPALRVAAFASIAAAILVLLGWNFLLRPWKANELYEQGLVAVKQNDGNRADDLFAQAWYYWPVQDRFFQYAEAYQDTGDYDRARRKYLELLRPSVKPYRDDDKTKLDQRYGKPLSPLPGGLEGKALADRLAAKKAAGDAYYDYVVSLLSAKSGADVSNDIPGEVILTNPDAKGILDYSRFETDFGFNGLDREAHFRRADAVLLTLLNQSPGNKDGLLRKADNFLAWSQALSSKEALDHANATLSEYLRLYHYDASVTWRFVKVFLLEDQESELLKLRDRIDADKKMAIDGEVLAHLAGWLLDREEAVRRQAGQVEVAPKTIEEEYGVRPRPTPTEPREKPTPIVETPPAPPAEGGTTSSSGEKTLPAIKPPYKYPYSTQPYRPNYLDKVDTLLLRAMDSQKSLPELHFELSRFYREAQATEDERKALAAADAYFQRLEPRMARLNGRPALRVAASNRIGEIFDAMGQPLQAEKYYLDAQRRFEEAQTQGLMTLDQGAARVYRNLGNLYYRQTPGVQAAGLGTVPGGWDQARRLFEIAAKGHWSEPGLEYRLGVIHYEKKEFDQAVSQFFSLDHPGNLGETSGRDNTNLLYAMGNALFRSGNFASAEGYYRELLNLLREQRARITDFDPVGRSVHRALAQRLYETWNNLAASQYRASNAFRAGTPEFRQALVSLTTARAMSQILGRDLYEDKTELDVTQTDAAKIQAIRDNEAQIVAKTRLEKGLVEANMQVLSMIETAPPSRKADLAEKLEIFARIPLELNQAEAP